MKKLIFIFLILLFATMVYAYDSKLDNLWLTGKLGIGIESPAQLLHMVGTGTADTGWARFGLSTTEYTEIGHRGSNSAINAVGDGDLDFRHDNVNAMELSDAGNLNVIGSITAVNIGSATDEIENIYMGTDKEIYFGNGQENYIKGNSTQVAMCGPTFCFIAK